MDKIYEKSEWEHINLKNLDFSLNNHDGLKWDLFVSTKTDDGCIRGMPIGWIVQGEAEDNFKFITNPEDKKYIYRMLMSGKTILFFRKEREGRF